MLIGHGMATASMFCARFPSAARVRVRRDGRRRRRDERQRHRHRQPDGLRAGRRRRARHPDRTRSSIRWGDTDLPTDRAGLRQLAHDGHRQRREARGTTTRDASWRSTARAKTGRSTSPALMARAGVDGGRRRRQVHAAGRCAGELQRRRHALRDADLGRDLRRGGRRPRSRHHPASAAPSRAIRPDGSSTR